MLVDSHAHLNFPDLEDNLVGVLNEAKENGVAEIICVGTNLEDSRLAVEIAKKYTDVYATAGIHPDWDKEVNWNEFEKLLDEQKVVAIGECGLDYSKGGKQPRQGALFEKQIELARKRGLPLVIHVRDAYQEIMAEFGLALASLTGVFHCFSGTNDYAQFVLEKLPGFRVSFAGNITFKNGQNIRDLAKMVPLERILVETDSPFLAPEPVRGLGNTPANVKIVVQQLAEVKGTTFEEIASVTTQNAKSLFRL